jgi:ribosomal protein S18 acetylase RimI-like enzyme
MMKDSQLSLRKALPDDSKDIELLQRQAFSTESLSRTIFSSPDISRYISYLITESLYQQGCEENLFFVAHIGKTLAGYLHTRVSPDALHINYLAVAPDYQGKGIGKSLLKELQNFAANRDVKRLTLDVDETNKYAFQWYHNLGFSKTNKTYVYCQAIDELNKEKCKFKISGWLNAEAWQYAFGFSRFVLELSNLPKLNVGRIGKIYWRIDEAQSLKNPKVIYALKTIDAARNYILSSCEIPLSFINTEPKETIFRMEKLLK